MQLRAVLDIHCVPLYRMSLSGGYDFSQLFHASVAAFSPGSTFLATIHNSRLIIRSTSTLSIVRTFQCLSPTSTASSSHNSDTYQLIDQIYWSADSLYILAFSSKSLNAWVFGLTEEGNGEGGEVARLGREGVEGLVRVEWGRRDREVLAWSDYGVCTLIISTEKHKEADGAVTSDDL